MKKIGFNIGIAAAILLILIAMFRTPGTVPEGYVPQAFSTVWSLLPPVVAIVLALITKEVYSSLFIGILVGAFLYGGGNAELALNTMLFHESGGLVAGIANPSHAAILIFVVILASLVVLMNKSGGAGAFGRWADSHIKSPAGAQLATILLGIMIFVDDGFNCMTVGSVMRPITDGHRVSRAKLAYLIDSTAAPICIIAPISCWAAAVTYAVPEGMNINGFQMFLRTIPYNLYALTTLLMVVLIALRGKDFGPMRLHEMNAREKNDLFTTGERPYDETEDEEQKVGQISNLVIPVVVLIVLSILGMIYTGGFFSGESLIDAFSNADSARGLVMGGTLTILITFWLYRNRDVVSFKDFMACFPAGFRSMCAPMIILILSWNLSGVTGLLGAGEFIDRVVSDSAGSVQMFVPMIVFLVSVFLAFSTGTSWGTFTILIPIVCNIFPATSEILVISIAACLAGAVCGDHCSPISDTTIMSSAGAHCDHINHVSTQLPYALTVAVACGIGYLIAGIIGYKTESLLALIATPATFVVLVVLLGFLQRRQKNI